MRLKKLSAEGQLRKHKTSAREIAELLAIVERDLKDASQRGLSVDRRFTTAYNAALQLATIALHAAGYRTAGRGHHWTTLHALPEIMGLQAVKRANYLDACRTKRNVADYDRAGEVSDIELTEILEEVRKFRTDLIEWLKSRHPNLLSHG
jgi:hypothetical protein